MLVNAGAVFVGKNAEVTDELFGRGETVDVHDLGDEDGRGGFADAGDGDDLDMRAGGQVGQGVTEQTAHFALGLLGVPHLVNELADERLGDAAVQRGDRMLRGQLDLVSQILR